MATSTYGTPYVQGSDLVSSYPTVSSSLATRVDEVSYRGNGLNAQTGTTYTLVVGDAGKTITLSNASPVAVTLPQDSTADLPDGAVVTFYNLGAGTVTISQGTGATLQGGSITLSQYAVTSVIKLSANTYGKFDGGESAGITLVTPTSTANSGGSVSTSGGSITATGVTSISLNGVFSSTYENYLLVIRGTKSEGTANVDFRLRASGSDDTGSNYIRRYITSGGAGTTVSAGEATVTYGALCSPGVSSPFAIGGDTMILGPNLASQTLIRGFSFPSYMTFDGTRHTQSTAYDGITLLTGTGNITATIRIYGFRN